MEKEFSFQWKETLLFLSNNMTTVTSDANQQFIHDFFLKLVHRFLDNVRLRRNFIRGRNVTSFCFRIMSLKQKT